VTGTEPDRVVGTQDRHGLALVVGAALVGLGGLLLIQQFVPWFGATFFWPVVVVVIGILVLISAKR
jgi:phage shock protein C